MKRNFSNIAIGLSGAILFALTIIIFLLVGSDKSSLNWIAFYFLLVSEFALTASVLKLNNQLAVNKKLIVTVGFITILVFYWIVTLYYSIFSSALFTNVGTLLIVEFVTSAIVVVFLLAIIVIASMLNNSELSAANNDLVINTCEQKLSVLCAKSHNHVYWKRLNTLYEEVKFSNRSVQCPIDNQILNEVMALEALISNAEYNEDIILNAIEKIFPLLTERKAKLIVSQRGSN